MTRKKISFLFIIGFTFLSFSGFGQKVSMNEAEKIGKNFIEMYRNVYYNEKSEVLVKDYSNIADKNGETFIHVFNFKDGGFVLVSGDYRSAPVLGYSYDSEFDLNNLPPAAEMWISGYVEQLKDIEKNEYKASEEINKMWANLYKKDESFKGSKQGVSRLIETRWNQDYPYNYFCPPHPIGPGGRVYAGCVATAMAQVMKYHDWPDTGRFSNEFFWGIYYEIDFSETEYQWDDMGVRIYAYDTIGRNAIAELIFHCGVAVNMNYGHDGSSASVFTAMHALRHFFKYKPGMSYEDMYDYEVPDWKFLLKQDLDRSKPILYRGMNNQGYGHAYVVDGYQDTSYFHFNWGWGGFADGFYYLDNINPQTLFPWNQGAVVNLNPYYGEYCDKIVYNQPNWSFDDGSGPNLYYPETDCEWLISTEPDTCDFIRLTFTKFNTLPGDTVKVFDGYSRENNLIGAYSGQNIPPIIESSGNELLITFTTESGGQAPGWAVTYESIIVGINDNVADAVSVFPNPANNTINVNTNTEEYSHIKIYDIYGKKQISVIDSGRSEIDISKLAGGVYFVTIENDLYYTTKRIIKQ